MKRKFRNTRVENPHIPGMWFDSKLERSVWDILFLRQKCKNISELQHHPGTIFLGEARIQYRPDFTFLNHEGIREWAEAKGMITAVWRLKKKQWKVSGPGKLWIYIGDYRRPRLAEVLDPKGAA